MIDITFLLIIFFVTVTQISDVNNEEIPLPQAKGEESERPPILTINVLKNGEVKVSGRTLSQVQLIKMVGEELVNVGNNPALLRIALRVDRTGTSKAANDLVTALKELGVTQVRISVESTN